MSLEWIYILYGILLVVTFLGVIIYYFNPKRKDKIEKSKYSMLEDDEPQ
jgi:cbb3-type cytochrome oxidase subunit 3